jgi:hypothetical protein
MSEAELTAETLRALFDYDRTTGVFTWKRPLAYKTKVGQIAGGALRTGHIRIRIHPKRYMAHRLAWLYVYGHWPIADRDHIDGDPANNRIENLREVTHQENMQNRRTASAHNKARLLGVSWCPRNRKWRANLGVDGKTLYLGLHTTPEAAHEAYLAAKRLHHTACTL